MILSFLLMIFYLSLALLAQLGSGAAALANQG